MLDLGHLRPILRHGLLPALLEWARDVGDDFVYWTGPVAHVVPVRPSSVMEVLGPSPGFVRNPGPTSALFGEGLLRLDGKAWRTRRAVFAPAFTHEAVQDVLPVLQEELDRLIADWSKRKVPFRPARELSFCMLRTLGRFLFGFSFDPERHGGRPLHRSLVTLSTDSVTRHLLGRPVAWLLAGRRVERARRWLDALTAEILDEGGDTPFMDGLRSAVGSGALTRQVAQDEIRTFLVAGHETTATALCWSLALVARHLEPAEALVAEHAAATRCLRHADVRALQASNRWVMEAMRLFPPVPISISTATRAHRLGRLDLPAGTRVDVLSYVLHRLPNHWPEPDAFRPERFATPPEPGTYFPFLLGPHTCLGQRLAMLELPLAAARLAGAFHIELPDGPPEIDLRLSLHPKRFVIRVRPRSMS